MEHFSAHDGQLGVDILRTQVFERVEMFLLPPIVILVFLLDLKFDSSSRSALSDHFITDRLPTP